MHDEEFAMKGKKKKGRIELLSVLRDAVGNSTVNTTSILVYAFTGRCGFSPLFNWVQAFT